MARPAKGSPFGGAGERSETERASPSPESRHAAINCLFDRAMLSLCLFFSVSILALSVTFGDSSPKGRGFGIPQRFACVLLAAVVAVAPKGRGFGRPGHFLLDA